MKLHLLCLTILLLSLCTSMAQRGGSQNSDSNGREDDARRGGSFFGSLLFTLFLIGTFAFIASIVYYRYQVKKYRVVPFAPPSLCPKSIYPPVQGTDYGYGETELGGGDYKAPRANPLIEC